MSEHEVLEQSKEQIASEEALGQMRLALPGVASAEAGTDGGAAGVNGTVRRAGSEAAASASEDGAEMRKELQNIIEAVLFVLSGAVSVGELAKACGCDAKTAEKEVRSLMKRLDQEDGALMIREIDGKYQLCSSPKYFDMLVRVVSTQKKPELSEVLMETLAIIANKCPATRVDIERIRGVKSDFAVNKLIEYGLVEEAGRLNVPGRPALFRPTDEFYRRFGIENKYGLPQADEAVESRIRDEVQIELKDMIGE